MPWNAGQKVVVGVVVKVVVMLMQDIVPVYFFGFGYSLDPYGNSCPRPPPHPPKYAAM